MPVLQMVRMTQIKWLALKGVCMVPTEWLQSPAVPSRWLCRRHPSLHHRDPWHQTLLEVEHQWRADQRHFLEGFHCGQEVCQVPIPQHRTLCAKCFWKAQCPAVESLTNSMMMHGHINAKQLMTMPVAKYTFETIYLLTGEITHTTPRSHRSWCTPCHYSQWF